MLNPREPRGVGKKTLARDPPCPPVNGGVSERAIANASGPDSRNTAIPPSPGGVEMAAMVEGEDKIRNEKSDSDSSRVAKT